MRKLRIATGIEKLLMQMFDQPNARLERKIIQSSEFRRLVLDKWADWSLKEKRLMDSFGITKLPELCAINSKGISPEVSWMLKEIAQGPTPEPFAPFPAKLSQTGPQFPFTYSQFDHLRKRAGELKGTEMTRFIQVQPRPLNRLERKAKREEDLQVYKWKVEDDDDNFEEDTLNPKSTRFYPSTYPR
jgi:hypothetical protein